MEVLPPGKGIREFCTGGGEDRTEPLLQDVTKKPHGAGWGEPGATLRTYESGDQTACSISSTKTGRSRSRVRGAGIERKKAIKRATANSQNTSQKDEGGDNSQNARRSPGTGGQGQLKGFAVHRKRNVWNGSITSKRYRKEDTLTPLVLKMSCRLGGGELATLTSQSVVYKRV